MLFQIEVLLKFFNIIKLYFLDFKPKYILS